MAPEIGKAMWSKLSGIYLALFLVGSLATLAYLKFGKGRTATVGAKMLWALLLLILGAGLPAISHQVIIEEWKARSFSGEIVSDQKTDNHSLHRYRIEGPAATVEFLDELWEMKNFTTGDWVEKSAGSREVKKTPPGP